LLVVAPRTDWCRRAIQQIKRAGFTDPTPIQAQAWPVALSGRDLVAIAKTGSGKTCGFLLPGLLHIKASRKDPRAGPTICILAPTRELAMQIKVEADKFGRSCGIRNTCVPPSVPHLVHISCPLPSVPSHPPLTLWPVV
jgi:ATP-dependent RNA helicase DDX5/DBP2